MNNRHSKTKRKTTIELSEEQYFFLKEKALDRQKKNGSASIVSIIRELIEKDRHRWHTTKEAYEDKNRTDI